MNARFSLRLCLAPANFLRRYFVCLATVCCVLTAAAFGAPANFDSGRVTVTQPGANTWTTVQFSRTFAVAPVVVAGRATNNDAAPGVVRVRNVTTTGFEVALDEWDYLDGAHGAEDVHWLALTPGTHQFAGQSWRVGRLGTVNRTASLISFSDASSPPVGFTAPPVVLAQIESTANNTVNHGVTALKARISTITQNGFKVQLDTEATNSALTLSNESVGYIAVSAGQGYLDGKIVYAGKTGAVVTEAFTTINFPEALTNARFIAQAQTRNDPETGELRTQNGVWSDHVAVAYAEEDSTGSGNLAHTAEDVGYITLGDMPGEADARLETGDITITQATAAAWTAVAFTNTYNAPPAVVMGPVSFTDHTPVTVRLRNVTTTGFEFQLQEWDYEDGVHNAPEHLSYIAMERGTYAIGGALWQAGLKIGVNADGVNVSFGSAFSTPPAVFAQVAQKVDPNAVTARVSAVTTGGFAVELDESEFDSTAPQPEIVNWIAVQPGRGRFFSDSMFYEVGSGADQTSAFVVRPFSRMYADPFLFAALQTKNDPDPATLRWGYLFADKTALAAQEDEHASNPGGNDHSAETVAFLAIQGAVDTDGDGAPDAWETSVGLNPNNAADGASDPDGDLLTNQQEYHNRLDFVHSSNRLTYDVGTVTVSTVSPNAYEVDDLGKAAAARQSVPAQVRIYRTGGLAATSVYFTAAGTDAADANRAPASSADYVLKDASGQVLTDHVDLPANAQSVDVYIYPVVDTLNEYVEGLRLTVASGSGSQQYIVGAQSSAVVLINDAMDIPNNRKLFVGYFRPQGSAATSASGVATIILNGPNTKALISTDFSGLTTPQKQIDGSHIHFSNTDIVFGGLENEGLPPGSLSDYPWYIVDSGAYKAQRLVDALFQKTAGEYLYVNVHTAQYDSGEIKAILSQANGGVNYDEPADPPAGWGPVASDADVKRDCARFLTQATFGPTEADIQDLFDTIASPKTNYANRRAAYQSWLDAQWAVPQTSLYRYHVAANNQEWALWGQQPNPPSDTSPPANNPLDWTRWGTAGYRPIALNAQGKPAYNKESYDPDWHNRRRGWWMLANCANDQLRQRVAYALEQIFVVSDRDTTIATRAAFGHSRYYDMLGDYADGKRDASLYPPGINTVDAPYLPTIADGGTITFRNLLEDVTRSPIMGQYLSHLKNQAATEVTSPDENYAREIMQLFSIGLLQLWPDGSLKLDASGHPVATYDNNDIKNLARVFTGLSFSMKADTPANGCVTLPNTAFFNGSNYEYFHPGFEYPMKMFPPIINSISHTITTYYHDEGAKTVLPDDRTAAPPQITNPPIPAGQADANNSLAYANNDLALALDRISSHPNVAPFISRILIQRLVTSNPSRGYVKRVAEAFSSHQGNLRYVVEAILLDYEARSLSFVDPQTPGIPGTINTTFGKVKEPIIRYLEVLRAFGGRSRLPVTATTFPGYSQLGNLRSGASQFRYGITDEELGQTPNHMPSVFNWYLPDYSPGGVVSRAGLVAPELQITTENQAVSSINYLRAIEYGSKYDSTYPSGQTVDATVDGNTTLDNVFIDITSLANDYGTQRTAAGATDVSAVTYLVDRLDSLLTAGSLKLRYPYTAGGTDTRSVIIDQVAKLATLAGHPAIEGYALRVQAAIYLITSSPEYIIQR